MAHGDRLTVVNGENGTIVGQIEGFTGGTHGIAVSASAGLGYTDDGRSGEAASFDLATLTAKKRTKADADADGIIFDSVSEHVFVVNGDSGTLTVIDPKTDTAVATVSAGGKLEFAVAGSNGKIYVNGEEKQEIVRVDTKTNRVDARWPIPQCISPHGLAMDTATHRLFSSCVNGVLVVVNTDSGATVATMPIGRGSDAAAFDPKRKLVFSSNGLDGTLSVIQERDAETFIAVATIKTAVTARTMTLDPDTGRIYLAAAEVKAPVAVSKAGPPTNQPLRAQITPGTLKLLFFDPGN